MNARAIASSLLLLLLSAAAGRAADRGVNIAWDACGPTGVPSKSFDCLTNEGEAVLYASFMLSASDASRGPFYAYEASIGFYAPTPVWRPLADWWRFGSGECREGMLACTFAPVAGAVCTPIPGLPDTSWMLYYFENGSLSVYPRGIIRPGDDPVELVAGAEYFMLRLTIGYAKSTGTDSCPGCSEPISVGMFSIDLHPLDGDVIHIETPLRQQYVYWTGSTVPVRRTSWGLIKGLYR